MRYAPPVLDAILVGMALEGAALAWLWRRLGLGVPPGVYMANLLAGMGLLLAMRLALGGAWWGFVSAALLAALAGHGADLARQWKGGKQSFFEKKDQKTFAAKPPRLDPWT